LDRDDAFLVDGFFGAPFALGAFAAACFAVAGFAVAGFVPVAFAAAGFVEPAFGFAVVDAAGAFAFTAAVEAFAFEAGAALAEVALAGAAFVVVFVFLAVTGFAAGRLVVVVVATRYFLLWPARTAAGLIACSSCSRSRCRT
jgi:hypothetical protein